MRKGVGADNQMVVDKFFFENSSDQPLPGTGQQDIVVGILAKERANHIPDRDGTEKTLKDK